jgi:predicted membrane protein (TIGR00267 family)
VKGIADMDLGEKIRSVRFGSAFRRFLTNTVFDSTFMLLGVVIGSAFENPDLKLILSTMLTSSLALGISTGVSVYEAESLEQNRRIVELERALFRDLDETAISRSAKNTVTVISLLNFLVPLVSCAITIFPFLLVALGILRIRLASWISIGLALSILFSAGAYLGKLGGTSPWIKGLRMLMFGIVAFALGWWIESLI